MDSKKEKNIYAFAKVTKTRILHSLEEVKGLVNGKPDQIYKIFFSLRRQLNSYKSNVLMSTLRKQRDNLARRFDISNQTKKIYYSIL